MRLKYSAVVLSVFFASLVSGTVEVGPGLEIVQPGQGSDLNFSQKNNFSFIGARYRNTEFEDSNFTVSPENLVDVGIDFYTPGAGRQEYVSKFTASSESSQEVNFSVGNLPSDDFYEAFETGTEDRIFIGYTDSQDRFNFSDVLSSKDISVFNYGEKGVRIKEITFNSSDPIEGDTVKISANLSNEGKVDSESPNVTVTAETYNGSKWIQKDFRDNVFTVSTDSWKKANFTWEAKPGPWRFTTTADPENEIKETDETNNQNSTIYEVPSHEVFYGGTDLKLKLGSGDSNIHLWNPSISRGNIYFADSDASFYFSDLEPLGDGDFLDADNALDLNGHNDSVKALWDSDSDGSPDQLKTFSVGNREVDIPVINSTSDGSFKTGILYDSADGNGFDGSQDLVFITEIQDSVEGKYGIYDYESKVPATLRNQTGSTESIEVYTEIR